MRNGFVFCVLLMSAFLNLSPAPAVEIVPPEIGDSSVTIRGLTLPTPPAGIAKRAAEDNSWAILARAFSGTGGRAVEYYYLVGDTPEIAVALYSALMNGDVIAVVDIWAATWAVAGPIEKTLSSGMGIENFEAGSPSYRITGLEPGESVDIVDILPGRSPEQFSRQDGGWNDRDATTDGVLTVDVRHFHGPPYALPGETLMVLPTGESSGDPEIFVASGETVRLVVPVASHIVGASGVPFISDLSISNPFGETIDGWVKFVQEGHSPEDSPSESFHLATGMSLSWTDFIPEKLGVEGNVKGTVLIGGIPNWILSASSRNYAVDDEGRRFGIAMPGLSTLAPMTSGGELGGAWVVPGLKENSSYRSNLILAGAVPQDSEISIMIISNGTVVADATRTVPGYGLLQVNRVARALGLSGDVEGYLRLEVLSGGVVGGLSVVDESADDAAFIEARPMIPE